MKRDCEVIEIDLTPSELTQISEMEPEDERCKVGKCPYCFEIRNDLLPTEDDNFRCSECDSNYYWCSICGEDQSADDHCRHVFLADDYEWSGSGAWAGSAKDGFIALLDRMHPCFAGDLRDAVLSGQFYTWLTAPLIGSGGMLELAGMPERELPDGMRSPHSRYWFWGDALLQLGSGDYAEETGDGYHWIASLYKTKTMHANRITVAWIEEWLAGRTGRIIPMDGCAMTHP